MPLTVNLSERKTAVEREVKGDFGNFFITVRVPSIPDRLKARTLRTDDSKTDEWARFLLGFLTGWREIVDTAGAPVAFSNETYSTVLGQNESILCAVVGTISQLFNEDLNVITEDEAKNSGALPASTETPAAATPPSSSTTA